MPKPFAVTQMTTLMQWLWLLTTVPGCQWSRGTASFSQWQLHIKHHNEHQIIPEDTGNSCPSPAHSWRSTVARAEQVKGIWVTLQLLDTIQGPGERSGRAAMLQDKDVLAPFASPWPHLLLLGYVPNTVPFARGLKVYGSALFVMSFPGFSSLLSIFSPSFPFLEFEMKVVEALSHKRGSASLSRAAAICFLQGYRKKWDVAIWTSQKSLQPDRFM